jgi:hypothetical protein
VFIVPERFELVGDRLVIKEREIWSRKRDGVFQVAPPRGVLDLVLRQAVVEAGTFLVRVQTSGGTARFRPFGSHRKGAGTTDLRHVIDPVVGVSTQQVAIPKDSSSIEVFISMENTLVSY